LFTKNFCQNIEKNQNKTPKLNKKINTTHCKNTHPQPKHGPNHQHNNPQQQKQNRKTQTQTSSTKNHHSKFITQLV